MALIERSATENARLLRARFGACVLETNPRSVLDVGCGAGHLLDLLRAAGIRAIGMEPSAERQADLAERGLAVLASQADRLPFADASIDVVASRHVLHHVRDPAALVREAVRVARRAIVLAEPWRDPEVEGGALGLELDAWCKRQDRRLGRVHGPDHTPAEMLALLPDPERWTVALELHLLPARLPRAEVEALIDARLEELGPDDPDRATAAALRAQAAEVCVNGSTVLVARRKA